MEIRKASRKRAKIRMALQGPSGSGKTYGALLLAFGLCGDWTKIVVIDTENNSADLYAHIGNYNVVSIAAPFSPEKYIEAISLCEQSGTEVIILDSCSHEWDGAGGILDIHGNMAGNSFTNWSKLTPRHNAFIQSILQSTCHIIGTIRSKQDYVLQEKNGKMVPEKVGLKGITRDGMDYEFTVVLEIDIKHNANASKDRTGLFSNIPEFKIGVETGMRVLQWCNQADSAFLKEPSQNPVGNLQEIIDRCMTVESLIELYRNLSLEDAEKYQPVFSLRRKQLGDLANNQTTIISQPLKYLLNGQHNKPATGTK
jgi:hypothetical protein